MNNFIYIDFEYNQSNEKYLNLVCAAVYLSEGYDFDFWLYHNEDTRVQLKEFLYSRRQKNTIVCWNAVAEGRAFLSLGLNPRDFTWIDLHAEYKMLLNHNHIYMYGKQLINGVVRSTNPPDNKWGMTEEEIKASRFDRPQSNLSAACYKLLDKTIDTKHKTKMRDLIIADKYIEDNRTDIQRYCRSDIDYLPRIKTRIGDIYRAYRNVHSDEILWRGRSMVNTAIMESIGYPVQRNWADNFKANVPVLLKDLIEDINSQFPDYPPFRENASSATGYSKNLTRWREWIKDNVDTAKWMKTTKRNLSVAIEAWTRYFNVRHTYDRGNFAHQVIRFLKFNQNLNGFVPKSKNAKNKEIFHDSLGIDNRSRAYLNPYGSQSSRYQPKATGFLPLKAAWMRSMIMPEEDRFICGIDYASQEFLISALLSGDKKMLEAYEFGDVYLYTAQLAGAVPKNGTRKEYEKERDIFKTITLGLSYQMSKVGLADRLTQVLERKVDPSEAQEFIDMFFDAYDTYADYIIEIQDKYESNNYLKLADGWIMYGDNNNHRSVANMPIQGMGGCIIRKAVDLSIERGCPMIFPLHDAGYFEGDVRNASILIDKYLNIMRDAFSFYFKDDAKTAHKLIRLDANVWGPDMPDGEFMSASGVMCKSQSIYIDERSEKEYEQFKKYMFENMNSRN